MTSEGCIEPVGRVSQVNTLRGTLFRRRGRFKMSFPCSAHFIISKILPLRTFGDDHGPGINK